jgi:hypothetical protein
MKRKENENQRKGRKRNCERASEKNALLKGMRSHNTVNLAFFPCAVHTTTIASCRLLSLSLLYKAAFYSPFVYLIILFAFSIIAFPPSRLSVRLCLEFCFSIFAFCLFVFGGVSLSVCYCVFFFPV